MLISTKSIDQEVYDKWVSRYPEEIAEAIKLAEKLFTRLNGGDSEFILHFIGETQLAENSDDVGLMIRTQFAPTLPNACTLILREEKVQHIEW